MKKIPNPLVPDSKPKAGGSNPTARDGGGKAHATGVARRALASRAEANGNPTARDGGGLPDDLAVLFADAPETTEADLARLEKAAKALHRDPAFIAEHAKGLIVEDILRVMEKTGMSASALAGKIGKSRQYVSKILNEDRRVNFTIESLAEFSAALDLQLCLRLLPSNERMLFIRKMAAPVEVAPSNQFPDEISKGATASDSENFVPRNILPFINDPSYERACLSA